MWFLIAGLVFAMAAASTVFAVVCIVQAFTGRQVLRPESSRRSTEQVRQESRWAAGEWSAMAVGLGALLVTGNEAVFLICLLVAGACFFGLVRGRRRHTRESATSDRHH